MFSRISDMSTPFSIWINAWCRQMLSEIVPPSHSSLSPARARKPVVSKCSHLLSHRTILIKWQLNSVIMSCCTQFKIQLDYLDVSRMTTRIPIGILVSFCTIDYFFISSIDSESSLYRVPWQGRSRIRETWYPGCVGRWSVGGRWYMSTLLSCMSHGQTTRFV